MAPEHAHVPVAIIDFSPEERVRENHAPLFSSYLLISFFFFFQTEIGMMVFWPNNKIRFLNHSLYLFWGSSKVTQLAAEIWLQKKEDRKAEFMEYVTLLWKK